ncbi:hypothetical protein BC831DRAFT_452243 [Entophlyctis helioformis]|nr:hypothetical protein BC831DRAFT_452243 [Entophlyctis helioformis]
MAAGIGAWTVPETRMLMRDGVPVAVELIAAPALSLPDIDALTQHPAFADSIHTIISSVILADLAHGSVVDSAAMPNFRVVFSRSPWVHRTKYQFVDRRMADAALGDERIRPCNHKYLFVVEPAVTARESGQHGRGKHPSGPSDSEPHHDLVRVEHPGRVSRTSDSGRVSQHRHRYMRSIRRERVLLSPAEHALLLSSLQEATGSRSRPRSITFRRIVSAGSETAAATGSRRAGQSLSQLTATHSVSSWPPARSR